MHLFLLAAVIVTAVAAVRDLRTGHIPDALTLVPLAAAPFAHAIWAGVHGGLRAALIAFAYSIAGAVVCGLVPLLLYRLEAIGGGDVKLFLALGAICMPMLGLEAELYGFVAAAIIAPARLAFEGKLFATLGNAGRLAVNPLLPKSKRVEVDRAKMTWFKMGPAIFAGTALAIFANWS
jgi:prepilin peptidase CpaA